MKAFVVALALAVPSMVVNGLCISRLWNWFVSPLGVPHISAARGFGIALILGTASFQYMRRDEEDEIAAVLCGIAVPALALLMGWLVKAWWLA